MRSGCHDDQDFLKVNGKKKKKKKKKKIADQTFAEKIYICRVLIEKF